MTRIQLVDLCISLAVLGCGMWMVAASHQVFGTGLMIVGAFMLRDVVG